MKLLELIDEQGLILTKIESLVEVLLNYPEYGSYRPDFNEVVMNMFKIMSATCAQQGESLQQIYSEASKLKTLEQFI